MAFPKHLTESGVTQKAETEKCLQMFQLNHFYLKLKDQRCYKCSTSAGALLLFLDVCVFFPLTPLPCLIFCLVSLYLHSYLFFPSSFLFPLFAHVVCWSLRFGSSCGTLQGRSASAASFPATSETPLLLWWSMTSPVSQSLAHWVSRAQLAQFSC